MEDALFSNSSVLYQMQEVLSHDLVHFHVCVTVDGVQPGFYFHYMLGRVTSCFWQKFQWNSSAFFVDFDQLFVLHNVITA